MASPSQSNDLTQRLSALRARLDAVDTGIHRLLRERFEIVEEIGAAKGPHESVIRPAREAAVIENRLALHSGAMPKDVLAHFWRTMITAACLVQRPFAIHTSGALDAALFLYGPTPVTTHPSAAGAVAALGVDDIAVVPADSDWWQALSEGVTVISRSEVSSGGSVVILGGSGVAPGAGPEAAVLRDGAPVFIPASDIGPDDHVFGRYHVFPLPIPASRTSNP